MQRTRANITCISDSTNVSWIITWLSNLLPICLTLQHLCYTPSFCTRPLSQRMSSHTQCKKLLLNAEAFSKVVWLGKQLVLQGRKLFCLPPSLCQLSWTEIKRSKNCICLCSQWWTWGNSILPLRYVVQMRMVMFSLSLLAASSHQVLLILSYKNICKWFLLPTIPAAPALGLYYLSPQLEH